LPAGKACLAPVSLQGFALQILAEQLTHFIRELLYSIVFLKRSIRHGRRK
jgi:hypothetical protein